MKVTNVPPRKQTNKNHKSAVWLGFNLGFFLMAGFCECLVKCSYYFLWYKIEKKINGIKVKLILLFFWGEIKLKLHCFASIDAIMVGDNWWIKADHIQLSSSSEQQSGWKIPRLAPHLIPLTLLIPSTSLSLDQLFPSTDYRSIRNPGNLSARPSLQQNCSRTAAAGSAASGLSNLIGSGSNTRTGTCLDPEWTVLLELICHWNISLNLKESLIWKSSRVMVIWFTLPFLIRNNLRAREAGRRAKMWRVAFIHYDRTIIVITHTLSHVTPFPRSWRQLIWRGADFFFFRKNKCFK